MSNDVLIHYTAATRDIIIDGDTLVNIINKDESINKIKASDCAKTRVLMPEITGIVNNNFDNDLVRYGYSLGMDKDPVKGRKIKVPKKETELRELFNHNKTSASFWTTEYDKPIVITKDNYPSIFRGFFSSRASIKPGSQGYINIVWANYIDNFTDDENDIINKIGKYGNCNLEYNGSSCFLQSTDQIVWFLNNIGFIQPGLNEKAITLCNSKRYLVSKVLPIDKSLVFYYVRGYGEPDDYNSNKYIKPSPDMVNYIDKKTGKTPLHIALTFGANDQYSCIHKSFYPALWLIENGADAQIREKNSNYYTFENYKSGKHNCYELINNILCSNYDSYHNYKYYDSYHNYKYLGDFIKECYERNLLDKKNIRVMTTVIKYVDLSEEEDYCKYYYHYQMSTCKIYYWNEFPNVNLKKPTYEQISKNKTILNEIVDNIVNRQRPENSTYDAECDILKDAIKSGAPIDIDTINNIIISKFRSVNDPTSANVTGWDISYNTGKCVYDDRKEGYNRSIFKMMLLLLEIFDIPEKNNILSRIKSNKHYDNFMKFYQSEEI